MKLAAAVLALAGAGASACPASTQDGETLVDAPVSLTWRAEPRTISVGRAFVLHVRLCPSDAKLVAVDATMPEHRHGMNYRPSLKALGAGRWRVEGLLWHMSGRWQLRFDVMQGGTGRTLVRDVTLP